MKRRATMLSEWKVKREICEIGRRIYARQFAAGNDGNVSCRIADDLIVCPPTQVCKGFMVPEDLCTIDLQGRQISGKRKPTSETDMHAAIYRGDASARGTTPRKTSTSGSTQVGMSSPAMPNAVACGG